MKRLRNANDGSQMNAGRLVSMIVAIIGLVVALTLVTIASLATARPIIERGTRLAKYLLKSKPPGSQKLGDQLNEQVRSSLLNQLTPEMGDRLVFEEVPSWNPLPMDDPSTRMEVIRQVADSVPEPGPDWQELQGGVRDGYLLFLGALADYTRKHTILLDDSQRQLLEIRQKRGSAMQRIDRYQANSRPRAKGDVIQRGEETVLAWFTSPPDSKALGKAINDAYLTLTPNPQDFSEYPPISSPTSGDLAKWFDSPGRPKQMPISTVSVSSALLTVSSTASPADIPVARDPQPMGQVVAKLYARDWQLFRLRRGWLSDSLLEQYHRDGNVLLDAEWLFDDDGPLARIPIAIVVARDVLYRVEFATNEDYSIARMGLKGGRPLKLSMGGTTLIVEPGSASASDKDLTLTIAPMSNRAQIVTVVSLRY